MELYYYCKYHSIYVSKCYFKLFYVLPCLNTKHYADYVMQSGVNAMNEIEASM